MLLGVHVSIAGHIYEAVDRAGALGCTAMQIFPRDPRQWRKTKISARDIDEFRRRLRASKIKLVFVHIPYLVNLASPYNILYKGSIRACVQDMREAYALGAQYLVVHMGSHKESGEAYGLQRFIDAANRVLDKTRDTPVVMLLENTAGSGSWLGYCFEHQRRIIDGVEQKRRVGVCFDTCHAYAAGYDLASPQGYNDTIERLDKVIGLERVKLIHLNDTRDKLGSRRDRHEHIGKGRIGREGFRRIINDRRFKDAAFVLETPKDSEQADRKNLELVRSLRRGTRGV